MIAVQTGMKTLRGLRHLRAPLVLSAALWTLVSCAQTPVPAATPAHSAGTASASDAQAFAGRWAYAQSCGWQHSAELDIRATPNGMRGTWSDGTRVRGDSGELRGELRQGRLYLSFCTDSASPSAADDCPAFGAQSAYLVHKDGMLAWYRGNAEAPYLNLHRVSPGATPPTDDQCPDDDAGH